MVGKAGGEKWKDMSDAEKAPYINKATQKKTEYVKTLAAYKQKQDDDEEEDGDAEESDKSKSEINDDEDDEDVWVSFLFNFPSHNLFWILLSVCWLML
jgi:hypothetical protein